MFSQRDCSKAKARCPALRPFVKSCQRLAGQDDARGRQKLSSLSLRKAKVGSSYLCELSRKPQLMQAESKIASGSEHGMHVRGQLGQEARQMRLHGGPQLVQVIDHQHEAASIAAEVRENPTSRPFLARRAGLAQ